MNAIAQIPLYGKDGVVAYATVDAQDFERLSATRWHLSRWGYAFNSHVPANYMHRIVCELSRGDVRVIHHINKQKLDNRRTNLMVCRNHSEARSLHTNWRLRLYTFEELRQMASRKAAA